MQLSSHIRDRNPIPIFMFTTCSWNSSNINSSKELSKRLKLLSFDQRGHPSSSFYHRSICARPITRACVEISSLLSTQRSAFFIFDTCAISCFVIDELFLSVHPLPVSVTPYRYIIVGHGTARWARQSVGGTPRHRKGQESRERCDHRSAAANHSQCECVCGLFEYGWNRLFE